MKNAHASVVAGGHANVLAEEAAGMRAGVPSHALHRSGHGEVGLAQTLREDLP